MKCKNPDRSTSIVRWRYFYKNCPLIQKSCNALQGAYVAASTVCKQRLYDSKSEPMVLYFNAEKNNDWGDVRNWWKDSFYTSSADFVPRKIDTAIINATCNVNSKGGVVVYDLIVNDPNEQGFILNIFATVKNLAIFNGHSTNLGTISGTVVFNDYAINNGDILGDAYFHDYSVNNSVESIYKDAFFSNFSVNNGTVRGNAYFKDSSSNSVNGLVNGDAFFGDSSSNLGTVLGNFIIEQTVSGGVGLSGSSGIRVVILSSGVSFIGGVATINAVYRIAPIGSIGTSGLAGAKSIYNLNTNGGGLFGGDVLRTFTNVIETSGGLSCSGAADQMMYRNIVARGGLTSSSSAIVLHVTTLFFSSYSQWIMGGNLILRNGNFNNKLDDLINYNDLNLSWTVTNLIVNGVAIPTSSSTIVNHNNLIFRDDGYGAGVANAVNFLNSILLSHDLELQTNFSTAENSLIIAQYYTAESFSITIRETSNRHIQDVYYTLSAGNERIEDWISAAGYAEWFLI